MFVSTNYIPPGVGVPCPYVNSFLNGEEISPLAPFVYDPAKGNLLLDIRNFGIRSGVSPSLLPRSKLDAHNATNDSISRIAALSLDATTAEFVDTVGIVTAFQFDTTPALRARFETNTFVLMIPLFPTGFDLQAANMLSPSAAWASYPVETEQIGFFRIARIPASSLPPTKFFRLIWEGPQANRVSGGPVRSEITTEYNPTNPIEP